jgi:hypothetical protein
MRTSARLLVATALLGLLAGCGNSRPSDAAITQEIQSQLFTSADAKSASLQVATKDGVVTLTGTAPSDAAHLEAYKIASQANGVTKVDDQITVEAAATEPEPAPKAAPEPPAPKPARKEMTKPRAPQRETVAEAAEPTPPPAPAPVAAAEPPAPPPPPAKPAPPPPPPAPVMRTVQIPAGTIVRVQTIDSVDSAVSQAGDMFRASLAAPIVVDNEVVVPAGTDIDLRLAEVSSAGRLKGRSEVTLQLARLYYQGKTYNLASTDYQQQGASEGKRTAGTIGGAAAVGAIIGGLVGGGKGAAIGAGAGAGAGTAGAAATKAQQVQIQPETKIDFTLEQPVSITYSPDKIRPTR